MNEASKREKGEKKEKSQEIYKSQDLERENKKFLRLLHHKNGLIWAMMWQIKKKEIEEKFLI